MRKASNLSLVCVGLIGSVLAQTALGTIFNVSSTGQLINAVNSANATSGPHTINLASGTYNLSGELPVIAVNENITFQGGSANPADTVLHQTLAGTRFLETDLPNNNINNVVLTFNNLTFDNGQGGPFGGGALLVGGIGSSTTVRNCVFTGNVTFVAGEAGGAIENSPNGDVTVIGSRFQNNSAALYGGAIDFLNQAGGSGNLVVSNSVFISNSAASDGGAIKASAGPSAITIVNCSFESNQATGTARGGAIAHGDGAMTVNLNRFFNNTAATHANGDTLFQPGGEPIIDANRNWWGQNSGPGGTDIFAVGTVTATTWLQLRLVAGASSLVAGGSTSLTADLLGLNSGGPLSASSLLGLSAVPSTPATVFHNAVLGSLSGANTQFIQGVAAATFTAGATPGTGHADATLDNATLTASITIVGPPTANNQSVSTSEGTAKAITLTGSDPNSPPRTLTYIVTASPAHGALSGTAPNLTYTPGAGYFGPDSFQFKVNNGVADSSPATVSITVVGKPTANAQSVTASQDTAASVTLTGSDPNSPPLALTFIVTASPAHGALSGTAPNLTYTPGAGYFGPDSFQFKVNNGTADSSPATVSLTVVGKPTANAQSVTVSQDTATSVTLTGSDPNSPPRTLTYTVTVSPAHGTLSGPVLTYTPGAGYFGPDSFQFKVNNGTVDSSPATVSLTVVGKPSANTQSVTVSQDTATSVTLTGSDPNSPPRTLTYTVTASPAHGALSGTAPNLTYTPSSGYTGPDSFQFKVNNGVLDSTIATVSLTVQSTGLVITEQPQNTSVCAGSLASFTSTANGTPAPTVQWLVSTDGGASFNNLSSATATTLSFIATIGLDGYQYRAVFTSGALSSTSTVATLMVNAQPFAGQDLLGTMQNTPVNAPVAKLLANDTSPIGGTLSITAVSPASSQGGTVTLNGSFVLYTPKNDFFGTDTFTYTLSDTRCTTQGTVVVTVNSNNAPSLNLISIIHTDPPSANTVNFAGIPSLAYVIQWAPTPTGPWTDFLPAIVADATGLITYTDTIPPSPRFYRTRVGP